MLKITNKISINFWPLCLVIKWKFHTHDRTGKALWLVILLRENSLQIEKHRTIFEHEKIHVWQQWRGLVLFFIIRYFYYQKKYGYDKNPYEVYAYKHQEDWKK